jgi:hypothetical protein
VKEIIKNSQEFKGEILCRILEEICPGISHG